jgi:hypothetical protein
MRRRIRLTGRKQLSRSSVSAKMLEVGGEPVVTLNINDLNAFSSFPSDARILLRLSENKLFELLDFGTIGKPRLSQSLSFKHFVAPSCQLRIVSSAGDRHGLLLGSTDNWTLYADDGQNTQAQKGILLFMSAKIAPRPWLLEIRSDEYPIVYIDHRVPDARSWAGNNPIFLNCVLPTVISQVFHEILALPDSSDAQWVEDWKKWADELMRGSKPPVFGDANEKKDWVEKLVDSFCQKHHLSDNLIRHLDAERAAA